MPNSITSDGVIASNVARPAALSSAAACAGLVIQ
jgi:hypothetical protein